MANRLSRTEFYRHKLTGFVSLSGGRLGSPRAYAPRDLHSLYLLPSPPGSTAVPRSAGAGQPAEPGVGLSDASDLPDNNPGEYELTACGLPDHSRWAQKLRCKAQTRRPDIVDTEAGYVSSTRLGKANRTRWQGLEPKLGRARVFVYPECADGHIVADVIRLGKGHSEGLEPRSPNKSSS